MTALSWLGRRICRQILYHIMHTKHVDWSHHRMKYRYVFIHAKLYLMSVHDHFTWRHFEWEGSSRCQLIRDTYGLRWTRNSLNLHLLRAFVCINALLVSPCRSAIHSLPWHAVPTANNARRCNILSRDHILHSTHNTRYLFWMQFNFLTILPIL